MDAEQIASADLLAVMLFANKNGEEKRQKGMPAVASS
jgi:hypothetical protein